MKLGSPYWGHIRSSFALAQFTYSCDFFRYRAWKFKTLARLREICMWLSGYFTSSANAVVVRRRRTSSTVAICSPPPFSSSHTAVRVISRRPATVVCSHRCCLSRSFIVSRGLKISSNICLGLLALPFHFMTQNTGTQFQGNLFSSDQSHSNVLAVVGHSARQGIEHERVLLHYYISLFITLSQALSHCRLSHVIIIFRAFAFAFYTCPSNDCYCKLMGAQMDYVAQELALRDAVDVYLCLVLSCLAQ